MSSMYMPYTPYSEAAVRRTRTAGDGGFESSKRSTREDSSKKLHRHRHSIQDPPGSHHHRRPHARSHKHHGIKDAIGSTLPPGFENLAKQGHANADSDHTPSSTAHASRQGSNGQIDMGDLGAARQALVKAEDVEREKWKAKARDEELLNTLNTLSDHSLSATRRLDDVYYSILEKISNLRNTISSLQELSTLTRDLHHDFIEESHELTDDIEGQIDTFGDFEGQKQKVDDLEKRIQKGRERAQGLDKRLARCRERVTWVEKKDAEEADKAGRFYKMLWSALGILVAILLTILIVHHLKAPLRTVGSTIERPSHTMNLSHVSMPPPVKEMLESVKEEKTRSYMKQTSPAYQKAKLEEEDERLRVFNEL